MKKVFIIILLLFFATGCDVEYNLKIDADSYAENININLPQETGFKNMIKKMSTVKQISYIDNSNKKNYYQTGSFNDYSLNYNYNFDSDTILKSQAINRCYNIVGIEDNEDGKSMTFYTNTIFKCLYIDGRQVIDKATINITTPLKVLESNADKVEGNKYTWVIDETNFENKPISIKMEKPKTVDDGKQSLIIVIISLIVITGISYIVYRFLRRKHIKRNEI